MTREPDFEKPDWDCYSKQDVERFEAWTNRQLDAADEPTREDIERDAAMPGDAAFTASTEKHFGRERSRGELVQALKQRDAKAIERLTRNDELRRLGEPIGLEERARRKADLKADLLALERFEEGLIERAQASGHDVPRRLDASPLAILGVAVAGASEARAA